VEGGAGWGEEGGCVGHDGVTGNIHELVHLSGILAEDNCPLSRYIRITAGSRDHAGITSWFVLFVGVKLWMGVKSDVFPKARSSRCPWKSVMLQA
jgi:hypothetical protein